MNYKFNAHWAVIATNRNNTVEPYCIAVFQNHTDATAYANSETDCDWCVTVEPINDFRR